MKEEYLRYRNIYIKIMYVVISSYLRDHSVMKHGLLKKKLTKTLFDGST